MIRADRGSVGADPAVNTDTIDPPSLAAVCHQLDGPLWVWRGPDGRTHVGAGEAMRVVADGETRFGTIGDRLERLTARLPETTPTPRAYLGASFFPDGPGRTWDHFPAAVATVPAVQLSWTPGEEATVAVVEGAEMDVEAVRDRLAGASPPAETRPQIADSRFEPSPTGYRDMVASAVDRLARPPLEKVVLAGTLHLDLTGPATVGRVVDQLTDRHPDAWVFAHAPTSETAFVGATPERLVSLDGRTLETVALAGSIDRGDTPAADDRLANRLVARERDRHEHASVVGDIVSRLGPLSRSVRVARRRVRRLPHVQHLEAPIRATLRPETDLMEAVGRLHPTPAVGGRPRASALATIREMESIDRGWYAAPIGWVDASGRATVAVAIRSALIRGDSVTCFAGNGIVPRSDPDAEWDEVRLKFEPMREVFAE